MSATEEVPDSGKYETQIGDVSGAVHAGHGDIIHIEEVELAATRAADGLQRALSADEDTRARLREVLRQTSILQAQLGEWKESHHILHEVLAAFSPFHASLRALSQAGAGSMDRRALLQAWRPCQTAVDRLADFEGSVEYIRLVPRREGAASSRPDWGARIAALRREVEERLREDRWNTEGLIDLADEFHQACDCYLSLADRELRRGVEKVQTLYTRLLGGLG